MGNANIRKGLAGFGVVMLVILAIFVFRIEVPMLAILALGIIALILLLVPVMHVKHTVASFENRYLNVNGSGVDVSVPVDSIRTFELRDRIVFGDVVRASTNGVLAGGTFRNSEFGDYSLTADTEEKAFIVVRFNGNVLVFNLRTAEETRQFYETVKPAIPTDTRRR